MPFRAYSSDFTAAELESLMAVYDECCLTLDLSATDARRAKLAAKLVELARGGTKDLARLRELALDEFRNPVAAAEE